jgi:hypothetical protein
MSEVRHSAEALPFARGGEALGAFWGQVGGQNVGGGVQIVLRVAADQFLVLREGHVAFDDAGAHRRGGHVGFPRVLGKLQRRAAVADGEQRLSTPACRHRRAASSLSAPSAILSIRKAGRGPSSISRQRRRGTAHKSAARSEWRRQAVLKLTGHDQSPFDQ